MINTIKKHKHRIALAAVIFFFAGIAVSKNYIVKEYVKHVLADMTDETQSIPTPTDTPTDTITPTDTVTPTDTPTDSPTPSDVSGAGDEVVPSDVVTPTVIATPTPLTSDEIAARKAQADAQAAEAAQADQQKEQNDFNTKYDALNTAGKAHLDKIFVNGAQDAAAAFSDWDQELRAAATAVSTNDADSAENDIQAANADLIKIGKFEVDPYPQKYASFMQEFTTVFNQLKQAQTSLVNQNATDAQSPLAGAETQMSDVVLQAGQLK